MTEQKMREIAAMVAHYYHLPQKPKRAKLSLVASNSQPELESLDAQPDPAQPLHPEWSAAACQLKLEAIADAVAGARHCARRTSDNPVTYG